MEQEVFWDWSLSNVSSVAQLVVSAAGFSLAIVQLWRTADTTVQNKKLLQQLQAHLIANDLLVALPDLHELEDDMMQASSGVDRHLMEQSLVRYYRKVGEVMGTIEAIDDAKRKSQLASTVTALKQAASAARKAKGELAQSTSRPPAEVAAATLAKAAIVSEKISMIRAQIQRDGIN